MKIKLVALGMMLCLSACGPGRLEQTRDQLQGQTIEQASARLGPPTTRVRLNDGSQMASWHRSGRMSGAWFGGANVTCDIQVTTDGAGIIQATRFTGNDEFCIDAVGSRPRGYI